MGILLSVLSLENINVNFKVFIEGKVARQWLRRTFQKCRIFFIRLLLA